MTEYIDRERLNTAILVQRNMGWISKLCAGKMIKLVKEAPAADVAPVVHGRWIVKSKDNRFCECSNCRKTEESQWIELNKYCYHCGAKMDGGANNIGEVKENG